MKNKKMHLKNMLILSAMLPFVAGCGGGGLAALGLGSLFASFGGGGGDLTTLLASSGGIIPHTPEPARMLLLGSGMATMAYFKSRKDKKHKA